MKMIGDETQPWLFRDVQCQFVRFGIFIRHRDGSVAGADPLTFRPIDPGVACPDMMQLSFEDAQKFMDAFWDAGFRPTQGHGSAGQLAATEKHLEDMRKLTDKLLGKVLA